MRKNIVIVTPTPSSSEKILPVVVRIYPECHIHFVHTFSVGVYVFKYPRNLKFNDFPQVKNIEWKLRPKYGFGMAFSLDGDKPKRTSQNVDDILRSADEIIAVVYDERMVVHAFQTLILHTCSPQVYQAKKKVVLLESMLEKHIESAFLNFKSTSDKWFVDIYNEANLKKYFEYNFNLNSAVIFGKVLTKIGVDHSNFILSKFGLIILYYLKSVKEIKYGDLLVLMSRAWIGTGKYNKGSIGSPLSRATIVDQFIDLGLLENTDNILMLSDKGQRFLEELHPDCCDLDLPFRIEAWIKEGEESRSKMDKYIKTFFGKQMRFLNKSKAKD